MAAELPTAAEVPVANELPAAASDMIEVGEPAPDFELADQNGQMHTLAQYRGRRVVLYFYPKDDTPGCTKEACGFRDNLAPIEDTNTVVLGVSPDPVSSHERFALKFGLNFSILADVGAAVAQRYGVWQPKQRFGHVKMGIVRTTFILDAAGRVARVFRNVRAEQHAEEVAQALRS